MARLINGRAYKKSELLSEGKYPVLRVGNFFTNQSWYYSDLELDEDKYCDSGDLLYAWSASFGPRVWEGGKVIYHYHIWKVDFDPKRIDKRFLYYWFEWDKKRIKKQQGAGTTMIHVTKGSMEDRRLLLPVISEQKRIVAILDEAFAGIETAIANTEKNLANARELYDGYLGKIFKDEASKWPKSQLSKICTFSSGGTPSKKEKRYWEGAIPWISGRDMKSRRLQDSKLHISEDAVEETATRIAPAGSILILVRGMGLAHGAQVAELMAPCAFNQDIRAIHPVPEIFPRYLVFALRHRIDEATDVLSNAAHGTLKIDAEGLRNVRIPMPDRETQVEIMARIDELLTATDNLKGNFEKKIANLSELKQSLLQKAFSGELTADRAEREVESVAT